MHAEHLEAVHGVGPHTISVPRIKHADDIDPSAFDNGISDDIFAKICALVRISVPYTGMIIPPERASRFVKKYCHSAFHRFQVHREQVSEAMPKESRRRRARSSLMSVTSGR